MPEATAAESGKGWVILADLDRVRRAVQFRERCVKAALDHYRWVDLRPVDTYARAAFDAMEPLIREDERRRIAEEARVPPSKIDGDGGGGR